MKRVFVKILFVSALLILSMLLSSCASTGGTDAIFKPEMLYKSPALDFTKVSAVAVMPVNCYSNEVTEMTGMINDGLPAELKRTQTAWNVISDDEVLRKLNEKGYGRGYQNYIADLNTYTSAAGATPNFTAETQTFFDSLKSAMNFQAILFTSYGYGEKSITKITPIINTPYQDIIKELSVSVVLYDLTSHRTWWVAKLSLHCGSNVTNAELARKVIEGIASHFGQGTLRQL